MKNLLTIFVLIATTICSKAQTLEETVDYIKLKTANSNLWYNSNSQVTTSGCNETYEYFFTKITSISYSNNSITFFNKSCDKVGSLVIFLDKIKSVELTEYDGKKYVALLSSQSFFEVSYEGKKIDPQSPSKITMYKVDNPEKLLNAFKHLFKLLNINLVEDKF